MNRVFLMSFLLNVIFLSTCNAEQGFARKYVCYDGENEHNVIIEGDMMVDFELYDYDDVSHHLNDFIGSGKFTILEFSCIGCGPCEIAKPILTELYNKHNSRLELITISNDPEVIWKTKPNGVVEWHEWNDHKLAREIFRKYGVEVIPTFVLINPDGVVKKKCIGISALFEAIKQYIHVDNLVK